MSELATPAMIPRYVRSVYAPEGTTIYDVIWTDRLSGQEVTRYDGADPANTHPAYGGMPDSDWFEKKGLDINEGIELEKSVLPVPDGEAERFAARTRRIAERKQEDEEACDLLTFLGADAEQFDFDDYYDGERKILTPALEKRGYTAIRFYMVEQDSFGPLIRGCAAQCHCGKRVRFFYG
ncbi:MULTISPECIES: hypothetical protein [unclassified Bradyrhizobium]|uniref:hypothetical protein n=1 Tax=Bradyrhizobium sp. USDA 4541 TaxID=2817704 RepID=UPI0020A47CAF|nr:hypothetical protein [Bradyrhizobium sp. USDA 4541]MCP1852881.1 hypothetical protein [Bradyrhizobium sp. USDA 4541]